MNFNKLILPLALVLPLSAFAERKIDDSMKANPAAYDKLPVTALSSDKVFYTEYIQSFADWNNSNAADAQVMSLYEGFKEPKIDFINANNQPDSLIDYLTMYVAKTKTVLNKPAAQVNVKAMVNLDTLNSIDPEMKSKQITANELMNNVLAAGKPITNFDWCNANGSDNILKPKQEKHLDYIGGKKWCDGSERSLCVESCYLFNKVWRGAIKTEAGVRAAKNLITGGQNRREDLGVAMQSEIRYYVSEAEFGARIPLAQVTHINTPVRGIVEQSSFYYNQVFKYSKILSIIQEHPTDASKSIMTNIVTMGVRTHSWEKPMLADHLQGEGLWNDDAGLTAGIPWLSQNMTKKIAGILEK
ncbi:MAG: hypothetical protein KF799_15260 [Bdellovibrionales bacterium]|nr:hypothetical protein [Bdellovibrionales bacterium]